MVCVLYAFQERVIASLESVGVLLGYLERVM